ncbi:50S ribosomal protein L29 [Sinimarinibacterium sp. CAU 1509]|jgi:large subunit ribosomal protein L29|uniref:50S ribosomal protein L29 n=1 Tax=Sinimarinibacterium sp. CAU 1509 TaxID=2562283 RepID=UPI0010AC4277|nr:50S ribosomal protein L29 [Sinimarinibacterium sp. CAU 1509]TJY63161.1 50S ribosomal protein L29 [Sinimarinibacterium sp. CAU 1509]
MKAQEYVKALREKDAKALKEELTALRREQFNLRMQQATGQGGKPNLIRDARKKIARVKTVMAQQVKAS